MDDPKSWRTIQGQFISVIGANITCRCAKSLDGISPNAHLGDGFFDLILIRKTSRTQYLRHMMRLANRGDLVRETFLSLFCNFNKGTKFNRDSLACNFPCEKIF